MGIHLLTWVSQKVYHLVTMKIFCERLVELRTERGLTAKDLEKELKLGNGTVRRWEKELTIPNIEYLLILAKFFGVTADYLLGLEN